MKHDGQTKTGRGASLDAPNNDIGNHRALRGNCLAGQRVQTSGRSHKKGDIQKGLINPTIEHKMDAGRKRTSGRTGVAVRKVPAVQGGSVQAIAATAARTKTHSINWFGWDAISEQLILMLFIISIFTGQISGCYHYKPTQPATASVIADTFDSSQIVRAIDSGRAELKAYENEFNRLLRQRQPILQSDHPRVINSLTQKQTQ